MKTAILILVCSVCAACASPTSNAQAQQMASANLLPLGDGHVSSSPRVGYVFSCQSSFNGNGATGSSPWIQGTSWDPAIKPTVSGDVSWPSQIAISLEGDRRVVRANNLPSHTTGVFPIRASDVAYQYDRNPNSITSQNIVLSLPAMPAAAATPSCVSMGMIGFALSGAAIYNALDAAGRDAAAHEVQDHCGGHPQMQGQYHYHSLSACVADSAGASGHHSDLIGYALDGYGIYGEYGEDGKKLSNADLDACHGHTHAIMWDGVVTIMYHYHATQEYPYLVSCLHGKVS